MDPSTAAIAVQATVHDVTCMIARLDARMTMILIESDSLLSDAGDGFLDVSEIPPTLYHLMSYDTNGDRRLSAAEYLGGIKHAQLDKSLDLQCKQQYGQHAVFDGTY